MKILISKDKKSPEVKFNDNDSILYIEGLLIPENPEIFFKKLNNIIFSSYKDNIKFVISFSLEYFNTGAARFLYKLFVKLKEYKNIEIIWEYEADDEDILESGKEFETLTNLPFVFKEIKK